MAFDFKTATPEAGITDSNLLFGASSFAAANPTVYPVSTLRDLLLGGGYLAISSGKTLTVTETMTLTALGSSQTYTFPAVGGTVALLNAANVFSNALNTFGVQGTTRGGVVLANTNGATNNLTLYSSNSNASAWSLTFPVGPGTDKYALTTDGTGVSSWSQIDLTAGVTGTLPVGNGGTGRITLTAHGVLIGNATSGINATTAGSAGQFLVSGGASADPTWTTATFPTTAGSVGTILRSDGTNWVATTATYPATTTANQLLYSSANNTIGGLTAVNGGIVNYSAAGVVSVTATPTIGVQGTTQGTLTLANTNAGAYPTTLQSSNSAAAAWTLTLPVNVGSAGQPLITTDGAGTGAWSKVVLTQPATAATLTILDNKTFTVNKSLTLDGTDATTMTFPNTSTTVAGLGISQTFTGNNTFSGNTVAGSGTTSMTDGFIYIPAASGAPVGTPTAYANRIPLYYDTNDDTLYVYSGSWKNSTIELTIGTTDVNGGVTGRLLYDNGGTLGEALLTYSAANLQLGAADAASPVAQLLSVQSVSTGTSNTAGVNLTIAGSKGTGTGIGGSIIFQTASAGASGSTPNALSNAWALDSNQTLYPAATLSTAMTKGFMNIPGGAGAPSGVPANTTGFPMYYDSTNNYLYVYNGAWKRVSFADNFLTQE